VGKSLKDHFLRIDARSLGLFRLAFALVLLGDLYRRFHFIKEFYSNDGVLPNHNHLFNLRNTGQVWSFLHAFSTKEENAFAFLLILVVYVLFFLGYKTRVFHALSLVALVSLTGRNILLENAGNYAAIAVLAFTLFLPCGSRLSLDALRASMDARDEKHDKELNDRPLVAEEAIQARRAPGWSPVSLAAFAVLAQIVIIYLATVVQQRGAWKDGTALYYALNSERWITRSGAAVRSLSPGLLTVWTRLLYVSEWAVPALVILPFGFRFTRNAAVVFSLIYGLTLGVLFTFGLYAWTLMAAAALLIPRETWDAVEDSPQKARERTVIYDADCGVCLWLCRLLARLDWRRQLTFQGNDSIARLNVRGKDGAPLTKKMPAEVTEELVGQTVVVVGPDGAVKTRALAVADVVAALPLGRVPAAIMRLPGVVNLLNAVYDLIAARRQRISVLMGKEACGIPQPAAEGEPAEAPEGPADEDAVAPAVRNVRVVSGALREFMAGVVFAAALSQTTAVNDVHVKLPQGKPLAAVAAWPRMMAKWDVLTPEPPKDDEVFAVDGQTRGGRGIDTMTGKDPVLDPGQMRGTGMGQLWSDYLYRMHQKEWFDFQRAFRDYMSKTGPGWDEKEGDDVVAGLDAYWLKQPIPEPGQARSPEAIAREKMFTHSRGGRFGSDKALPILRPDLNLNIRQR
jgi:predicted DCC family thiol-disulfide oxidoreductase YuxK